MQQQGTLSSYPVSRLGGFNFENIIENSGAL